MYSTFGQYRQQASDKSVEQAKMTMSSWNVCHEQALLGRKRHLMCQVGSDNVCSHVIRDKNKIDENHKKGSYYGNAATRRQQMTLATCDSSRKWQSGVNEAEKCKLYTVAICQVL